MSQSIELVKVCAKILKKGERFQYDGFEAYLKSPIEDFSEEVKEATEIDPLNSVATEDNIGFKFEPIPLPMEGYNCISGEISNIGADEFFEPFLPDFEKITKKIIENEFASYNNIHEWERNKSASPLDDFAEFIAIVSLYWRNHSYYESPDEYELETDLVGILDKENLMNCAIKLEDFLEKKPILKKETFVFGE